MHNTYNHVNIDNKLIFVKNYKKNHIFHYNNSNNMGFPHTIISV